MCRVLRSSAVMSISWSTISGALTACHSIYAPAVALLITVCIIKTYNMAAFRAVYTVKKNFSLRLCILIYIWPKFSLYKAYDLPIQPENNKKSIKPRHALESAVFCVTMKSQEPLYRCLWLRCPQKGLRRTFANIYFDRKSLKSRKIPSALILLGGSWREDWECILS